MKSRPEGWQISSFGSKLSEVFCSALSGVYCFGDSDHWREI